MEQEHRRITISPSREMALELAAAKDSRYADSTQRDASRPDHPGTSGMEGAARAERGSDVSPAAAGDRRSGETGRHGGNRARFRRYVPKA